MNYHLSCTLCRAVTPLDPVTHVVHAASEGPPLPPITAPVWNKTNNSVSRCGRHPLKHTHTHTQKDNRGTKCWPERITREGRYLWQPFIPLRSKRLWVYTGYSVPARGRAPLAPLGKQTMSGPVWCCGVIPHCHPKHKPTPLPQPDQLFQAKSAFQGSTIWLIYCWLKACHMAFREGRTLEADKAVGN